MKLIGLKRTMKPKLKSILFLCLILPLLSQYKVKMVDTEKHQQGASYGAIEDAGRYTCGLGDLNRNGISDKLERLLKNKNTARRHFRLIVFPERKKENDFRKIVSKLEDVRILNWYSIINAYVLEVQLSQIQRIIERLRRICSWIELDSEVKIQATSNLITPQFDFWDIDYGGSKDITVAIVDSGVDADHPSLKGKVIYYEDLTGESNPERPIDNIGHGTMIASIIAGDEIQNAENVSLVHFGKAKPKGETAIVYISERVCQVNINFVWESNLAYRVMLSIQYENGSIKELADTTNKNISIKAMSCEGINRIKVIPIGGEIDYVIRVRIPYHSTSIFIKGVAPSVKLAVWKVFYGLNTTTSTSLVINALDKIYSKYRDLNITVVNLSISAEETSYALDEAVNKLATQGIFVVTPAGNSYIEDYKKNKIKNQINSPGTAIYAVTVAAVNEYLGISLYSSRGGIYTEEFLEYSKPDLAMFGGGIIYGSWVIGADSDQRDYIFDDLEEHDYTVNFGTSFAVAYISGYLALMSSLIYEQGKWEWSLDQLLYLKSIVLASTFETTYIGMHEEKISGEDIKIRNPPPFSNGSKDYDEGFGVLYFPALMETKKIYLNDSLNFTIKVSMCEPVVVRHIYANDLIRISVKTNTTNSSVVCIYKIFSGDGSPIRYWYTQSNSSNTFLGFGDILIVAKIAKNKTSLITIRVDLLARRTTVEIAVIGIGITLFVAIIYAMIRIAQKIIKKTKTKLRNA